MTDRASFVARSVALSVAALVTPSRLRAAPSGAPAVVNVGTFPIDPMGPAYYAQELGYFKDAGLDVRLQTISGGPQIAAAVASGAVDIGIAAITTLAAAHLSGIDFKFIAPSAIAASDTRTDVIVVASDSTVQKASDLNGKTVAISGIKSMQQVSAMSWVDKHGGDSRTLKFVELPVPQIAASLAQHRIDAGLLVEPFATAAKGTTRSLGDVLDGVAPTFMLLGYFGTGAWLQANAATASRFAAAIQEAANWANSHRKESADILVSVAKLDPAVASSMARSTYGTRLTPALVQPVIDSSVKYAVLEGRVAASDIVWQAPRA